MWFFGGFFIGSNCAGSMKKETALASVKKEFDLELGWPFPAVFERNWQFDRFLQYALELSRLFKN
jgi:hypothetical protein